MAIMAKDSGGAFTPAPEGLHRAVCVDVIDRGILPGYQGKETHKIDILWQLEARDEETEHNERFRILKRYTLSLNEKSNLSKDLEAWRGCAFTSEERSGGFDVELVVGANCQLQINHDARDGGRVWANIQAIVPAREGERKGEDGALVPESYTRFKDREATDGNSDAAF